MSQSFTCPKRTSVFRFALALALGTIPATAAHAQDLEGFTEPYELVQVAAPESGIVSAVHLSEGDRLSAQQIIAALDNDVLRATLESARAKAASKGPLAAAESALALRKRRLMQLEKLLEKGHASPEEIQRAKTDLEIAKAKALSAREQVLQDSLEVKRIESQLERRTIRSPIDGVVVRLQRKPGESVSAADPLVATVANLAKLRVRFYLPTSSAVRLQRDAEVPLRLPDTGQSATGHVEFVSPVTDSDSGTVRVDVVIENKLNEFRSGVRCHFRGISLSSISPGK